MLLQLAYINRKICQKKIKEKRGEGGLVGANTIRLNLKAGILFLNSLLCNGCGKQENAFSK